MRRRRPALTAADTETAWQTASLLLEYPDDAFTARLPLLRRAAASLPDVAGVPLASFVEHAAAVSPAVLAADYVATFDHRKRHCLYLTYYACGDTRKRGMALLRLKETYRASGLVLGDEELPDHLSVVLEYAASVGTEAGTPVLNEHRAGLEVLRAALTRSKSPWADVLNAVSATLPPLDGSVQDAVRRLAADGPPREEVGMAAYGGPIALPTPRIRTAEDS